MSEWRKVAGLPYEVSSDGDVRRADTGHVLNPGTRADGRLNVSLWSDGRQKMALVHRLVAEAFLGPCPANHETNHKNGNPADNRADNLEWVTRSQNNLHAYANGLMVPYCSAKTHCKRGHPFDAANTLQTKRQRVCRACARERTRRCRSLYAPIEIEVVDA